VLAHHERWDGNGYPNGWAKDAIPLEARILSVVDAYDAMISPRIYRKSLTPEEARAELERCAGHQFDPQVVAAFFRVLDEPGPAGHTQYCSNKNNSSIRRGRKGDGEDKEAFQVA
jgi:HD-GYP domain-containing protein (c-di-GMP phosphodiesterase class II)